MEALPVASNAYAELRSCKPLLNPRQEQRYGNSRPYTQSLENADGHRVESQCRRHLRRGCWRCGRRRYRSWNWQAREQMAQQQGVANADKEQLQNEQCVDRPVEQSQGSKICIPREPAEFLPPMIDTPNNRAGDIVKQVRSERPDKENPR